LPPYNGLAEGGGRGHTLPPLYLYIILLPGFNVWTVDVPMRIYEVIHHCYAYKAKEGLHIRIS
jgi:hypothetical protein